MKVGGEFSIQQDQKPPRWGETMKKNAKKSGSCSSLKTYEVWDPKSHQILYRVERKGGGITGEGRTLGITSSVKKKGKQCGASEDNKAISTASTEVQKATVGHPKTRHLSQRRISKRLG